MVMGISHFITGVAAIITGILLLGGSALAHVTVKPGEALTASRQVFTVSVPNEKAVSTTKLELKIPSGVTDVTPTVQAGWSIHTESPEDDAIDAIIWDAGEVPAGQRAEFSFSARMPEASGEIQWKAYQTYADGSVVSWDQPEAGHRHGSEDAGPFSVTHVIAEESASEAETSVADAESNARWSLYIAGAAFLLAGFALVFALKR